MQRKIKNFIFLILILILIIILSKILFFKNISNCSEINDYTFFKFFSNKVSTYQINEDSTKYEFNVKYDNIDFKSINILNTVDKDKNMYEKIAPGTHGDFDIVLNANKNLKYKIIFKSKSDKPENLKFIAYIENKIIAEASTLDELSLYLNGYIEKNKNLNIKIYWYWNYENAENTELTDIQDTEDSKKIGKYQFEVYAYGEQIS